MPRRGKAFNLYLSPEERAALDELSARTGRPLHDEIRHAIRRHLEAPPVVRVVDESPGLPPAEIVPPPPKKRGRPPKRPPAPPA